MTNHISKLYMALFLIASASSVLAYGGLLDGIIGGILGSQVAYINVLGRVVCTATGNVLPGTNSPGIGGVNVGVLCNNGKLNLGTLTTNATGFFDGLCKSADGVLFDPSTCVARIALPVSSCTILPTTGILQSVLGVGGLLNTLLGLVATLLCGPWQLLSI